MTSLATVVGMCCQPRRWFQPKEFSCHAIRILLFRNKWIQMKPNFKRGFNRLFVVMTLLWALFWAVVYPLHEQWKGQQQAFEEYNKSNKNCDALIGSDPNGVDGCYKQARDNFEA